MEEFDAFEMLKNNRRSNDLGWLKETKIVSYGYVVEVVTNEIVHIEFAVRTGITRPMARVVLINQRSAIYEEFVEPQKGDMVLLLFVDKYNSGMFDSPIQRQADTGSYSIDDQNANGYDIYSGVGILLGPPSGFADTIIRHYKSGSDTVTSSVSKAIMRTVFKREYTQVFDALPNGASQVDRLVNFIFGIHSPAVYDHRATTTRKYGYDIKPDKSLSDIDATVTEQFSSNAPLVRKHSAPQTITIGKANSPEGDPSGSETDVAAAVDITIGSDADVTITSDSGLTLTFKGPVKINGQDAMEFAATNASLVKFGNSVSTLGALIDSLVNTMKSTPSMTIVGQATGELNTVYVSALTSFKAQWDQVFS